jgi:hypothetical protein
MPPKKKLFCLIHGNPETSVFTVNYTVNTTVDGFKETIYTKMKNAFASIDYPDLNLYQVDIDLNMQSAQRTALSNPNANIVNDLGGQMLLPTRKVEAIFTAAPAVDRIHIIVDVHIPDGKWILRNIILTLTSRKTEL